MSWHVHSERVRGARAAKPAGSFLPGAWLNGTTARLTLSVLIVASLIPVADPDLRRRLDLGFLAVFGVEFGVRVVDELLAHRRPAAPRGRLWAWALLAVDLAALLSFVPWGFAPSQGRALRILRLSRLVLLASYWAPTVRDLGAIAARRERSRQLLVLAVAMILLAFTGAVVLDGVVQGAAYDFNADGLINERDAGFWVRLWWAFRQLQDPGNMVSSPLHAAAVLVSLALTLAGLFIFSFVIGLGSNVVAELVDLSRHRPPGLTGHTLIIGTPPSLPTLLHELYRSYGKILATPKVVVVGAEEDRPTMLEDPAFAHVVYRPGSPHDPQVLPRGDANRARRVLLLANLGAPHPDAQTTALALAAREALDAADAHRRKAGLVIAELAYTASRTATKAACGPGGVVVPVERLLGLFLAAAAQRPGLETLLRVLMTSVGSEIYTYIFGFPSAVAPPAPAALTAGPFGAVFSRAVGGPTGESGAPPRPAGGGARVVPLGWVAAPRGQRGGRPHLDIAFGKAATQEPPEGAVGFVAVARNFTDMAAFGEAAGEPPRDPPPPLTARRSGLCARPSTGPLRRVVICGYRPATVTLCELVMAASPHVEVLVLVAGGAPRAALRQALADHQSLYELAEEGDPASWGTFRPSPTGGPGDERWAYRRRGAQRDLGRLEVAVADWTSAATFTHLPGGGAAHIGEADLVVVQGALDASRDGEVALAVLKLGALQAAQPHRFRPGFRVVATVSDEGLAARLERRYGEGQERAATSTTEPHEHQRPDANLPLRVLSSGQLRGFFTFQAATVPLFERIYTRLLGPWSHSLMALEPAPGAPQEPTDFGTLAHSLLAEGKTLVAWELDHDTSASAPAPCDDEAGGLWVCPQPGACGDWAAAGALRRVWVVASDDAQPREVPKSSSEQAPPEAVISP